jgi:hypothetical protein
MDYYSYMNRADISKREIPAYVMADFKRLFPQEAAERFGEDYSKRFPLDGFVEYVRSHAFHGEDFSSHFNGFVQWQLSKERAAQAEAKRAEEAERQAARDAERGEAARAREAELKERVRAEYPLSAESFEKDWDSHLRAQYVARMMEEQQRRAQESARNVIRRGVVGGYSEPIHH